MKHSKLASLIYIIPFLCLIFTVPIFAWIDEDIDKSVSENRVLQQMPGKADLKDWTFTTKYEAYINDQLPKRDLLIKEYTQYELNMGRHFVRNLYIAESDQLILVPSNLDDAAIKQAAAKTNALAEKGVAQGKETFFAITPRKNTALQEMLVDIFHKNESEKLALFMNELDIPADNVIDVGGYFRNHYSLEERDTFYFKSDFHWNANGAINAFSAIYNQMNQVLKMTPVPFDASGFQRVDLENIAFQGDLNRRLQNQHETTETVAYYNLPNESLLKTQLLEKEVLKEVNIRSIYAAHVDQPEVSYNDLFTNNLGYYRVENPEALTAKKLLLFKDSYQNATLPFFIKYFKEIEVVDQRYLGEQDCYKVLENSDADTVLIMYNDGNIWGPMFDFDK